MGMLTAFLELMEWFSENRFQRIVLNDQTPEWLPINVGVLQQSNLGPLFLIYINGQSADILSTFNLFADDIIFCCLWPKNFRIWIKPRFEKTIWLSIQWKVSFKPDLNKEIQKIIFPRKFTKSSHLQFCFNNAFASCVNFQKHVGMSLDEKFNFNFKQQTSKAMKGIGVIRKPDKMVPQHSFIATIYYSFRLFSSAFFPDFLWNTWINL